MQNYYNDLVTKKSWLTLQDLRGKLDFVLIGGWAVFLYTKALKSKDIDLIVNYDQLEKLRTGFNVVQKDRIDILSLILSPDFDPNFYKKELAKTGRMDLFSDLKKLITRTVKIPEI